MTVASHKNTLGNNGTIEIITLFLRLSNLQKLHLCVCKIQFVDKDFVSSVYPLEVSLKVKLTSLRC